ncbi:3-oxoacyl-[acyl-carrier-protein] synthase III [Kitasatospora herbaricolor]|uniref:3-oxoacyl-ACP synthase III family protein n=1 Tax=Kitasatospora herbaricolor TaxID=68217 RepID=UPI00174897E3|nr:3-oxoacyl-ACP synthase III family protein [Kitasatospora herbaricolor]MDQ0312778.1 3-oxoacyl-[acyl-carrier-protein] synthase-3 [Kitasatospora herbaricolor]GGV49327.1 3-oxoacyl-[acyl-carrier-protein] synthase III [Kitasatospora herbaricolor]
MDPAEIRILAAGTALPGPPIDNATLGRRFGMDALWEQWVDVFIGTRSRHLALDLETGEQRDTLAGLGERAGRQALAAAGTDPAEIDLVILGTATPDSLMPATVNQIADRLGIDGVATYQLQSGCSGAVQALDLARQLLSTGRHRTALVLGGDVIAKHYDLSVDLRTVPPAELVNYVLFGDAAGAAVLSGDPAAGRTAVRTSFVQLVGLGRPPGQVLEWFGPVDRHSDRPSAQEDYKAIEESVPVLSEEILHRLLDDLGWKGSELTHLLPPQLSTQMTKRIVERLALSGAEEISCVGDTANTGNALVFFQLEQLLPRLTPGDRVAAIAVESSKWIKSGFALEHV